MNKMKSIFLFFVFALMFGSVKSKFDVQVYNKTGKDLIVNIKDKSDELIVEYNLPDKFRKDISDEVVSERIITFKVKKEAAKGWRYYLSMVEYNEYSLHGSDIMPFQFKDYKNYFSAVLEAVMQDGKLNVLVKRSIGGIFDETFFNKVQANLNFLIDYRKQAIPAKDFDNIEKYEKKRKKFEDLVEVFKKLKSNKKYEKADTFFSKIIGDIKKEVRRCKEMIDLLKEVVASAEKDYKSIEKEVKEYKNNLKENIDKFNKKFKNTKEKEGQKSQEFKNIQLYKNKLTKLVEECAKISQNIENNSKKTQQNIKNLQFANLPKYIKFFNTNLVVSYNELAGKFSGLGLSTKRSINNLIEKLPEEYQWIFGEI